MSVQAITAALNVQGASASEKLLLIVLANYANDAFECWPSQATLARNTGITDRGLRKIIAKLEEKGFITKRGRMGARGQISDLYRLNFVLGGRAELSSGRPQDLVSQSSAHTRNCVPPPPELSSDEPIIEPIIEPSVRARGFGVAVRPTPRAHGPPKKTQQELAAELRRLAEQQAKLQ